jgi:uncharacterized membrane protein YccF (DUF307 family)
MYMPVNAPRYEAPMTPMALLLNIIWLICGGAIGAFCWLVAAAIMALTIIGLPWSFAAFRIAVYTALPFGHEMRPRPDANELTMLGNLVWFVLAGWWLALVHLVVGIALAITIVGLPFAWAHLKLAGASLAPLGKEIVTRGTPVWQPW